MLTTTCKSQDTKKTKEVKNRPRSCPSRVWGTDVELDSCLRCCTYVDCVCAQTATTRLRTCHHEYQSSNHVGCFSSPILNNACSKLTAPIRGSVSQQVISQPQTDFSWSCNTTCSGSTSIKKKFYAILAQQQQSDPAHTVKSVEKVTFRRWRNTNCVSPDWSTDAGSQLLCPVYVVLIQNRWFLLGTETTQKYPLKVWKKNKRGKQFH